MSEIAVLHVPVHLTQQRRLHKIDVPITDRAVQVLVVAIFDSSVLSQTANQSFSFSTYILSG